MGIGGVAISGAAIAATTPETDRRLSRPGNFVRRAPRNASRATGREAAKGIGRDPAGIDRPSSSRCAGPVADRAPGCLAAQQADTGAKAFGTGRNADASRSTGCGNPLPARQPLRLRRKRHRPCWERLQAPHAQLYRDHAETEASWQARQLQTAAPRRPPGQLVEKTKGLEATQGRPEAPHGINCRRLVALTRLSLPPR